MAEPMTVEACRAQQSACSRELYRKIDELQASQQRTELAVARISGHLGLNGNGPVKYVHHRDDETAAAEVVAEAARVAAAKVAEAATAAISMVAEAASAARTTDNRLPALPRWAVIGLAGFVLLVLALVASDQAYERMKKPVPIPSLVTK